MWYQSGKFLLHYFYNLFFKNVTIWYYHGGYPSGLSRCETQSGYSDAAVIFIWITALCPANIYHLNLQLLFSSQETILWLCLKYKGWFRREGALRNHYTINRLSYTPVAINVSWLWCSPTASEGLSYGINFTFSWESMPPDNIVHCARTKSHRQLQTMHATPIKPHSRCMHPFFNLWILPWGNISISQAAVRNSPSIEGVFSFSQEKQVLLIVKIFDCCKL